MQLLNKEAAKKTFAHTWYVYPLLIGFITLIWIWGFQAFHLPSAHQTLVYFYATNIRDNSFALDIKKNYYPKEELREIENYSMLPSNKNFYTKLQLYLQKSDSLVLDQHTIDEFKGYQERFFVEMSDEFIQKYSLENYEFYTYTDDNNVEHRYGIKLKSKGHDHYLDKYMTFDPTYDYYITLSTSSVNIGDLRDKNNAHYDNAITFMKHLLELN